MSGSIESPGYLPARENPFASQHVDVIPYRFHSGDWTSNVQRLSEHQFHASVVGPKGSGKTTLLEQLAQHLQQSRSDSTFVRISRLVSEHRTNVSHLLEKKSAGTIVLVDGIERLSLVNRLRILQRRKTGQGGLVIAMHCPTRKLPTWVQCRGEPASLRHVLDHLNVRVTDSLWREATSQLAIEGGNIRQVLRHLYIQFANGKTFREEKDAA